MRDEGGDGVLPPCNRATVQLRTPTRGGARKEGPYWAVGPSPVQSISAYCSRLQSRRRNYLSFLGFLAIF